MSLRGAISVCRARNIPGIILGPSGGIALQSSVDWSTISIVTPSSHSDMPRDLRVLPDSAADAVLALETL